MEQTTGFLTDTGERKKIITQIVTEYRGRGSTKTDWKRAFREHPDWASALGAGNPIHMQRTHAMGAAVRTKLNLAHKATVKRVYRKRKYKVHANGSEPIMPMPKAEEPPLEIMQHCPHCGYNLLMHATAYQIARRHSQ